MLYVRVDDEGNVVQYPFKAEKIRRMYRNVSFPSIISSEILAEYNVFPVHQTTAPTIDSDLETVTSDVEFQDGKWVLVYTVVERPDLDIKQEVDEQVREKLAASLDQVMTYLEKNEPVPAHLSQYRSELRVVHLQQGYPREVLWPSIENDSSV